MLLHTIALAQASPRLEGNAVNVLICLLVVGAVVLVFWASRPSVMARYQAPPRSGDTPVPPPAGPRA